MYCGGKNQEPKWIVVPHCLMWGIWKEINSRCFEDSERSMPDLKLLFLEPYWTVSQCGETSLFLQFWIYLIYVIFVFDMYTPVYSLCTLVSLSLISINLYYLSKKKKKFKNQNYNDQVKQERKNKKYAIKPHSKQGEYARKKT